MAKYESLDEYWSRLGLNPTLLKKKRLQLKLKKKLAVERKLKKMAGF